MIAKRYMPYPSYENSGVEWLGLIPTGWKVKKLKYLCKIQTGTKDTVNAVTNGEYPFFVRSQKIERIDTVGADCEAVLTAGDGVGVGKVYHYFKGEFDFHQRVYMLNNFKTVTGRFVYYYLSSNFHRVALDGNAKSTVDSLRLPQFLNFDFTIPDIEEQKNIVNFLDSEIEKIDIIISKQESLIKLLKEKRRAVISKLITKGLDDYASVKETSCPWLGKVPTHWNVGRLKNVLKIRNGKDYKHVEIKSGGYPVYGSGGVFKRSSEYLYDGVSVLYGRKGTIDKPLLVEGKFWTVDTMFYSVINKGMDAQYIYAQSTLFPFDLFSTNTALPSVAQDDLSKLAFVIPPAEEQKAIAEKILKENANYKILTEKAINFIALMKEKKATLVTSAVTGKIDVRNWEVNSNV